MLIPNFQFLQIEQENGFLYKGFDRAEGNPKFFTYRYFVFWEGSPVDGMEFFSDENSMSRTEADVLIARLEQDGKAHWVYNRSIPRSLSDRVRHSAIITGVACFHRTSAQRYNLKTGAIGPYRSVARPSGGNGGRHGGVCLPTFLA